ncbi:MAG: carboxypeptidase-like regulatory domain-containing protein, partial [Candidatus Nomurabacteria bacterium]|nr:carboxypeptidase-like regulatory domain-containing protein [Candidatus Nomurabacteria bacterium]
MYKIIANKTNYIFPSARLQGKFSDELYDNLYFGDTINILKAVDVLAKNIPMDPMNFDWNEYAKKQQHLLHFYQKRDLILNKISSILFYFGFALSSYAILNVLDKVNITIFVLYIVIFFFRTTLLKPKQEGTVTDRDGSPLAFAIIRVFSAITKTEVVHKTTNALGKYYCLIANGHYYVKIEKHNIDDTYTPVYTSGEFEVREGVV